MNKRKAGKLKTFIKENKIIIILFLLATIFFIYQRHISLAWDFNSYVLNGQYWFGDGKYFELLRPPLMSLIISLFSFVGWRAAEFIFIISTSLLFMYSSVRLAKVIKFNPTAFYALSLNVYLLSNGLINGTELLALAFLELCICFIIENNAFSGLFLGLSALSRYAGLFLFPIVLLHLNVKKILKSLLLFAGVMALWLGYNFYSTGNLFTSIADQYANNILYRHYLIQPIKLIDFLLTQNILIPFFIIGVVIAAYTIIKSLKGFKPKSIWKTIEKLKIEIIMFFLLVYSIISYTNIPVKNNRYLFNLVLPTFYFSYIGICYLINKFKGKKKLMVTVALVLFAISLIAAVGIQLSGKDYVDPDIYRPTIPKLNELNLSNCSIMSNSWVMLNYMGRPSLPPPRHKLINESLEQGQILVLFKQDKEPEYVNNELFIKTLPIIYEHKDYYIIGTDKCLPIKTYDNLFVEEVDRVIYKLNGYHINKNPCFTMFHKHSLLEKTCNFLNLKGFKQDENRIVE